MTRETYAHLAEGFGIYAALAIGMPASITKGTPEYYARLAAHFGLLALRASQHARTFWQEAANASNLSEHWEKKGDEYSAKFYAERAAELAKLAEIEEMR